MSESGKQIPFAKCAKEDDAQRVMYPPTFGEWIVEWKTYLASQGSSLEQVMLETKATLAKAGKTYDGWVKEELKKVGGSYDEWVEKFGNADAPAEPVKPAAPPASDDLEEEFGDTLDEEPSRASDESLGLEPDDTPIMRDGDPESPTQGQFWTFNKLAEEVGKSPELNKRLRDVVGGFGVTDIRRQYLAPEFREEGAFAKAVKDGLVKPGPSKCWTREQLGKAIKMLREILAERAAAAASVAA